MSFIAGVGITNVDLLYQNMPRIPAAGEEVYTDRFSLQLGGGLPATLINLGRLGVPTRIATELGDDLFSGFAKAQFEANLVQPMNLYHGSDIPLNITSAIILKNDRSFITYGKSDMQPDDAAKASGDIDWKPFLPTYHFSVADRQAQREKNRASRTFTFVALVIIVAQLALLAFIIHKAMRYLPPLFDTTLTN